MGKVLQIFRDVEGKSLPTLSICHCSKIHVEYLDHLFRWCSISLKEWFAFGKIFCFSSSMYFPFKNSLSVSFKTKCSWLSSTLWFLTFAVCIQFLWKWRYKGFKFFIHVAFHLVETKWCHVIR